MRIVILDAKTLGEGVVFDDIEAVGDVTSYPLTAPDEIAVRIANADVVIVNKIRLNESNLREAKNLKLICVDVPVGLLCATWWDIPRIAWHSSPSDWR